MPFADRLGPLIRPSLEPVPSRATRISSGEDGHDGGIPEFRGPGGMRGVVSREIDREASRDGRSDEAPVLDSNRIGAEDGFVGEGDDVFAGVGGDELFEERTVDLRAVARQVACLSITPETAGPDRRNLGAELRPGCPGETAGYAIPMHTEG